MGELGIDRIEEGGNFAGFCTALVFREKGVVGFVLVAPVVGLFAGDFQELGQMGGEGGELVFFASFGPGGFGEGGGFGVALDEFLGKFGSALVSVGEFALVGRIEGGEAVAEGLGCLEFVNTALQVSELLGAVGDRLGRGIGFLIPVEGGGG